MYGSTHPFYDLGFGHYSPGSNGGVYVKDTFCDGDNGIIAALYYWNYSEWKRSDLTSVRGCGATNYNDSDAPFNSSIRFRVCKLLPDGTWKDCFDKFTLT